MERESSKIAFCQSCGRPLGKPEDFGKNANGSKSEDYCRFCSQNGKLTRPDITMEQLIDKVAKKTEMS